MNPRARYIDVDFEIDMRKFANFKFDDTEAVNHSIQEELEPNKILLTEQFLSDNEVILSVSNTINEFIKSLPRYGFN